MHPYRLRPMQLDDLEAIAAIEAGSFPTPWPREGYERELLYNERAHYQVLLGPQEQIIGYAGQWLVADEAHISIIAVAPAWRGRGLGALVLLALVEQARAAGADRVLLEVRENNRVARQLYRDFLFVEVGRRDGYYKDTGEDAVLMTLELDRPGVSAHFQEQEQLLRARLQATCSEGEES